MTWKDARRQFYWAVRARVAQSQAIAKVTKAAPSFSTAEAERTISNLIPVHISAKDNRGIAEALEGLELKEVLHQARAAHVAKEMLDLVLSQRKAGIAGLIGIVGSLSVEERAALGAALQAAGSGDHSPGPPSYHAAS